MSNVFIDCGSNLGQGLKIFSSLYNMDSTWTVETFEPNPLLIESLRENISSLPMSITVHNKAVWCYDGEIEFSMMMENSEGSSVNKLMDSGICLDSSSGSYRKHDTLIKVPCVNITSVLRKYSSEDNIIVKLDVEGSEFSIVRKLLEDNSLSLIKDLYIEWHTQYMSSENIQTQNELIQKIYESGTRHHFWH